MAKPPPRLLVSTLRIVLGVGVGLALLVGGLGLVFTQPTVGCEAFLGSERARPENLRRHVEFLTTEVHPRDSDHPENLARAGAYVKRELAGTKARVEEQEYRTFGKH